MKFKPLSDNNKIPFDQRKKVNEQLLMIVKSNDDFPVSKEEVYNGYTGKGGLHGLKFDDFNSFYDYTEAKKKIEYGQFYTPDEVCGEIVQMLKITKSDLVCDFTSGKGSFINAIPNESNMYANEIDIDAVTISKYVFPKAKISCNNIINYDPSIKFDFVLGNPPFNIKLDNGIISQTYYFEKTAEYLKDGGLFAIITPATFLKDNRFDKLFSFIGQYLLPKKMFNVAIDTKVMFFQKNSEHIKPRIYSTKMSTKEFVSENVANVILQTNKIEQKLKLANAERTINEYRLKFTPYNKIIKKTGFDFIILKQLYEMKHQPRLKKQHEKCIEYLKKYKTQMMPKGLSIEMQNDWHKNKKITKNRVIFYFKNQMKETTKERKSEQLSKRKLTKHNKDNAIQNLPFSDVVTTAKIEDFVTNKVLFENDRIIKLNDIQKKDVCLAITKRFQFLRWGMGCGKTIAGVIIAQYRMEYQKAMNTFVVSNPLSINATWSIFLKNCNISFVNIRKLNDIAKIKKGDFVLMTPYYLTKYKKAIKNKIKTINNKYQFIFDESDISKNPTSRNSKSVNGVFYKAKYKLLMSGTITRNNISEAFTQLSFLLNNKLVNNCDEMFKCEKDNSISNYSNFDVGKPFKKYLKGFKEFKNCFNPDKTTVLGIGKQNQNVYNVDELKTILESTLINRELSDILGHKSYEMKQIKCKMSSAESDLNINILNNFDSLRNKYFSMNNKPQFRILQQLHLLLRACAVPQSLSEFSGKNVSKFDEVAKLINEIKTQIAIGVMHLRTVKLYKSFISKRFPNRKLFVITGQSTTIEQRVEIVKEMKQYKDSILLSTQQSLNCSINIDFVDNIIIPELNWNFATLSQYFARFIRFTSVEKKVVNFVTYEKSIEINLLKLIVTKENINRIIKEEDDFENEFGIGEAIFDELMSKSYNEDGKVYVSWGSQKII